MQGSTSRQNIPCLLARGLNSANLDRYLCPMLSDRLQDRTGQTRYNVHMAMHGRRLLPIYLLCRSYINGPVGCRKARPLSA